MKIEELTEKVEETTGLDRPTFAHFGRLGWQTDPGGPTALCGARLIGVPAVWPYRLCPDCERLAPVPFSDPGTPDEPVSGGFTPDAETTPEEGEIVTFLVGVRTREELLGEGPEDVTFLQSKRPWQVKAKADVPDPPPDTLNEGALKMLNE